MPVDNTLNSCLIEMLQLLTALIPCR